MNEGLTRIYTIHLGYKGSAWEDCKNNKAIWVGSWYPGRPLGDLRAIVPATWQGLPKQKYLQYFGRMKFYASAGNRGAHAARMLRMFYLAPVGSVVISTGQAKALGVGKISSAVKYQYNKSDPKGHADEDYVREVDEWIILDVPSSRFAKPVRGRLFHPYAVLEFPQTLFGQFVATIVREKGQAIARKIEGLL